MIEKREEVSTDTNDVMIEEVEDPQVGIPNDLI